MRRAQSLNQLAAHPLTKAASHRRWSIWAAFIWWNWLQQPGEGSRSRCSREPLHGIAEITFAAGAVLNTYKMKKHFDLKITDDGFSFARKTTEVAQAQRS